MSIWDDVAAQSGISIYAGLSPEQALQKWYGIQQEIKAAGLKPGERGPGGEILGSMETLAQQNPDAFRLLQTGKDRVKQSGTDTRQIFDPNTGQWKTQEVKGWWSHPESWAQLIAGGSMAAAAPAAIASGAPAASAPAASAAAPVAGEVGTGTLVGGTGSTLGTLGPAGWSGAAGSAAPVAGSAAAAGGSTLGKLAPYLIGAGTDLAGGLLGSRAANKASQQQLAYGEKAMDAMRNAYGQELGFYGQQRDVYAPYNQIGQSALGNLARLTGSPVPQAAAPNPTMVRLRAPDGSIQAVPDSDVQHYIQRGAQIA